MMFQEDNNNEEKDDDDNNGSEDDEELIVRMIMMMMIMKRRINLVKSHLLLFLDVVTPYKNKNPIISYTSYSFQPNCN